MLVDKTGNNLQVTVSSYLNERYLYVTFEAGADC